jgi:hypothetical protein
MKKYRLFSFFSFACIVAGFLASTLGLFALVVRISSTVGGISEAIAVLAFGVGCIMVGFAAQVLIDIEGSSSCVCS